MKCTAWGCISFFIYWSASDCVLFIELFTNRHVSAIKKNNYSIFIPIVAIWLWGLRNKLFILQLASVFDFVLYWLPTKNLDRSWIIGQTGRIFFSAEDYTNMSYYNCCVIRPKHSNISKRVGEGVITICVVLDQSTVIFQKGGGGYYNVCGIEFKIMAMLCFISWLLICRVCSHPRRFSISITNQ